MRQKVLAVYWDLETAWTGSDIEPMSRLVV